MHTSPSFLYAIDSGNSSAKYSIWDIENQTWITTYKELEELNINSVPPSAQLVYSGVGATLPAILSQWPTEPLEINADIHIPFQTRYDRAQIGSDRIAAIAGVFAQNPSCDALIIDAGTCITFDVLSQKQGHLGGVISPGLRMRSQAMHEFTGKLPLIQHTSIKPKTEGSYPTNTKDALARGAFQGWTDEIQAEIDRFLQQFPEGLVYMCGGDASHFEAKSKNRIFAAPLLVFEGLVHLWTWNR